MGGIKPETANAARRWLVQQLNGEGARAWWEEMGREAFSDDLVVTVDRLVGRNESPEGATASIDPPR